MTHPTLLILGALSGASLSVPFAYAAPQEQAPAEEGSSCACNCAACLAKHGPKATTVGDTPAQEPVQSAEIDAVREALAAVEAEMERERKVGEILSTKLEEVDALLLEEPIEEEPIIIDVEVDEGEFFVGSEKSEGGSFVFATPAAPASSDQGYLGVELGEGDDGVEIARVMDGSPAQESGIQAGDVIFNIAGTTVMDLAGLRETMKRFKAGDTIGFGVMRDGRPVNLSAKLTDLSVVRGAIAPQVEGTVRVVPAVPPAPPVPAEPAEPAEPAAPMRIRLLPNPAEPIQPEEAMEIVELEITEASPEIEEEVEVILAQPIRLPKVAVEPQAMPEREPAPVRIMFTGSETKGPKAKAKAKAKVKGKAKAKGKAKSKAKTEAVDALPEGYVEIMTRRERRPARTSSGAAALQARIDALEAEVAELSELLADIRRELNRRNLR